jgi:Ser-tRNA(Ala) deacylase AlaX
VRTIVGVDCREDIERKMRIMRGKTLLHLGCRILGGIAAGLRRDIE